MVLWAGTSGYIFVVLLFLGLIMSVLFRACASNNIVLLGDCLNFLLDIHNCEFDP